MNGENPNYGEAEGQALIPVPVGSNGQESPNDEDANGEAVLPVVNNGQENINDEGADGEVVIPVVSNGQEDANDEEADGEVAIPVVSNGQENTNNEEADEGDGAEAPAASNGQEPNVFPIPHTSDIDDYGLTASQAFAQRWKNGRVENDEGDVVCLDIMSNFEKVRRVGYGFFSRVYKVVDKKYRGGAGERRAVALKLCSFRRLSRPINQMTGTNALSDLYEEGHPNFPADESKLEERIRSFRLEKTIVRCLTGLSPFVAGMVRTDDDRVIRTVIDARKGELGYPMELMVANLCVIWGKWGHQVTRLLAQDPRPATALEKKDEFRRMIVFVAAQLADALRFLNCCGVVHHEIHPYNVLMDRRGYVKLNDFSRAFVELDCEPPASVKEANARARSRTGPFGPPEDMWNYRRPPGAEMQKTRHSVDAHMLGYTLLRLDYPVNTNPCYQEVKCYNPAGSTFDRFLRSYSADVKLETIDGPLLDFISKLMKSDPLDRLGRLTGHELIKHEVFAAIDFKALRKKTHEVPMNDTLRAVLDSIDNDWRDPAETPWCFPSYNIDFAENKLNGTQRAFFYTTFERRRTN